MKESFSRLRQLEHHINETVRLYDNIQTDDYPAHWNNSFEVIMPVVNEYTVYVSDVAHVIQPGEVLIIPAGAVHEIYAPPVGRRYIFMIEQSQFYAVDGLAAVQHCFYPCVHLSHAQHEGILKEVSGYLKQAVDEYNAENAFGRSAVRLWLGMAFLKTARYLIEDQTRSDVQTHHRHHQSSMVFMDVCTYIAEHCSEKLNLADVAAYSGYSKYHFARMFKVYSGMSFYDFFMRQRMLLCEKLLSDMSLPVTEVAMRSGFGSIATFNRIFKQYEKVTPSEYRRLRQLLAHERTPVETATSEK
ncbi:MAG: helix-turn-helix transcriptional regulator [Clostridia bacterium]|nr:helix-turn-helix transcriptional regulator [Clostridia bacterium]